VFVMIWDWGDFVWILVDYWFVGCGCVCVGVGYVGDWLVSDVLDCGWVGAVIWGVWG